MRSSFLPIFITSSLLAPIAGAAPPAWWVEGGVPAIAPAGPDNNLGPANVAQAKWMAFRALGKLQTIDPVLASAIYSKLTQPQPKPGGGTFPPTLDFNTTRPLPTAWAASQRAPLLLGQLKAISAPFYDLLQVKDPAWLSSQLTINLTKDSANPANYYPWSASTADDANLSPATVGQLKSVFSLRFETLSGLPTGGSLDTDGDGLSNLAEYTAGTNSWAVDTDGDGLPDKWEVDNGLDPLIGTGVNGGTGDFDGDGYNNLQEFYLESNPNASGSRPKGMIAARRDHSLALSADGRVWAWGRNSSGQLGDGPEKLNRNVPILVPRAAGMGRILKVGAGDSYCFALDDEGVLWGWGSNSYRQLSKELYSESTSPVRIQVPSLVANFACGANHAVAVDRSGRIWAWGHNSNGQLGVGHASPVIGFAQVTKPVGMGEVISLAASNASTFALDSAGKVWSWGSNSSGILGDGTTTVRYSPVAVSLTTSLPPVKAISATGSHVMAVANNGAVWTWGYNGYGQLGNGNTSASSVPYKIVTGLLAATSVAAGDNHSLGVSDLSFIWGWGNNGNGQLGRNSTTTTTSIVQTTAVTDFTSLAGVAAGVQHSLGLKTDGTVWSWGYNYYGQLGLGDGTQRLTANKLPNLKLHDDDSDADGLPDSWERFFFGDLSRLASAITVPGGVTNQVAYQNGLVPTAVDNDVDGITDVAEIAAGLDPLDWADATGDLDGDKVPNVWEFSMGTNLSDSSSFPAAVATVLPGQSIQSAIDAVTGNSGNPPWVVIRVQPAVYNENLSFSSSKRIALIAGNSGNIAEIRGTYSNPSVAINGDAVIDGFRITHAEGISGSGVQVSQSQPSYQARIVNCLIHDQSGSSGIGVYHSGGRLVIGNSSIFGNSGSTQANGFYSGSGRFTLLNSVLWNEGGQGPQEAGGYGIGEIRRSVTRDGSLPGSLTLDPRLNSLGMLTRGSPYRGEGSTGALSSRDIHGEPRGNKPDIGADQYVDGDEDGLPDWLELLGATSPNADNDGDGRSNIVEYETNGTDPTLADTDGDGLNDSDEILAGSDPFDADTDNDGMLDGWEVQMGLSPVSDGDALTDLDGDRIPNLWEFKRNTLPNNGASRPAADWVVNPALAGTGNNVATIQQAINNASSVSSNPAFYSVIEVRRGTYLESVDIPSNKKIALLGELGYPSTEIRSLTDGYYSLEVGGEAFVDGFRITRTKHLGDIPYTSGSGVYVYCETGTRQVSLSNLTITGHSASSGGGVYVASGRLKMLHCTIYGNSATYSGNSIYTGSGTVVDLQNCIVRGGAAGLAPQQISKHSSSQMSVASSLVENGEFGASGADPALNPQGFLRLGSPAINTGTTSFVARDAQNELRVGNPDVGADEFVDGDADGLPDWYEALGVSTPGLDGDSDGRTNLAEYESDGTSPVLADSDGDGLNDGAEFTAGTKPLDSDTDSDAMLDGWEVQYSLNPLNDQDALEDADRDRFPNVYEFANTTNPNLATSYPAFHITVDPATVTNTTVLKKTIQAAIDEPLNVNRHTVIRVKPGIYTDNLGTSGKRVLLMGDLGASSPVIAPTSGDAIYCNQNYTVLDGFHIRSGGNAARGLRVYLPLKKDQMRIINCTISGFSTNYGAGAEVVRGRLTVAHCTVMDNVAQSYASGFYVQSNARLHLRNSIVWNPNGTAPAQIHEDSAGLCDAVTCVIKGGQLGGINLPPLVDRYYGLMTGSPAIGAGSSILVSGVDRHGESRSMSTPDIGADQRLDSDSDVLPDWWEISYFGNLTKTATGDNDSPQLDRLTNYYEYLLGFNPLLPSSPGSTQGDLFQAVFRMIYDPWYPSDWWLDPDNDGFTNNYELYYQTSPTNADTNGDGISDATAIFSGVSATSTDTDGDGVSNAVEVANGTNPVLADSDGDGVNDNLDPLPLDPSVFNPLPSSPADVTAPLIQLRRPAGAVLQP